jgi:RHS repeat-associated protein
MKTKIGKGLLLPGALLVWLAVPQTTLAGGACTCARFNDWKDLGCRMSPGSAGAPGSGANQAGGNQANCPTCPTPDGIPRWWVDEPYENLFITDEPLSYFLSSGQKMVFRWHYKQRYQLPQPDECPSLYVDPNGGYTPRYSADYYLEVARPYGMTNAGWGHNWMMDIMFWDPVWESLAVDTGLFRYGYEALVFRPEGGIAYFYNTNGQSVLSDPLSQVRLETRSAQLTMSTGATADANGIVWDEPGAGFRLVYPDGSQDVFGLTYWVFNNQVPYKPRPPNPLHQNNSTARAFLTQRIDPQGRVTQLGYEPTPYLNYVPYRVRYVVDADGRTNTFTYNDNFVSPFTVSQIRSPYGATAQFTWGGNAFTNGLLLGITDAANNPCSFGYSGISGWITNLTTPYGTTAFSHYQVADSSVTNGFSQRAVYVSEPGGAHQLFYYLHQTNAVNSTATAPTVPGRAFDDGKTGGNHRGLDYRNTFHWDRRQYAALSVGPATWLPGNLGYGLGYLTPADFTKASLRHWLWADGISISGSVSSERDPSPDAGGQIEGARTWYSYSHSGNPSPEVEGAPQVLCVARVLPDSTSQYVTYDYYGNTVPPWGGLVWFSRSSYSQPDGTTGELTNWFNYANGIDLLSVNNSLGQYANFGYNAYHQVTSIAEPLNRVTQVGYNASTRNLSSLTLPNGLAATLTYYSSNTTSPNSKFVSSVAWTPTGRSLAFTYSNSLPQVVHATGIGLPDLWVTNYWDRLNRLTGHAFPDSTTTSNAYDRLDLGAAKDRLGYWTTFQHDGLQHLTSITDALTNVTQLSWCDCGALSSITNALTNTTSLFYNNQGLLTTIQFPDSSSVTRTLDSIGRVVRVADGLGKGLNYGYNNQGLLTTVSNAYGLVERIVYDAVERPFQITDANNVTVTNQFDLLNRLVARFWPDGVGEGFGWETNGLVAYTNRNGKVTRFARDGAGRLTAVTNANQEIMRVAYNALNEVTELWDGRTNHTGWTYNEFGQLATKADAFGLDALRLRRDANGQVTNRWTPQMGDTAYILDRAGNLKTISNALSTINYTYDSLNRLKTMADAVGTTTFSYTTAGQFQSEDGPWTSDTLTNGYTEGQRTSLSLNSQPSSLNLTYSYDWAWRLYTLSAPAGNFGYGYNTEQGMSPASLVRSLTLPNSAGITNHYDSLERLDYTALVNKWGHVLDGYSYSYDYLGLRTGITRDFGLTNSSVTVGYDSIGQLTSWQAREGLNGVARLNEQVQWVYDAAGNLRYRTNGGLFQTFTSDTVNQLASVTRNSTMTVSGVTPAPASSVTVNNQAAQTYGDFTFARTNVTLYNGYNPFSIIAAQSATGTNATNSLTIYLPGTSTLLYDSNGNLTNDGTRSFAYDAENRLVTNWVTSAWQTEFVYDGLGRRRVARDSGWQNGQWVKTNETRYVYDGYLAIQERDSNNAVKVTYTRGLDLSASFSGAGGIGGLLARTDGNGSTFYHADGAGNITALMDAQQNLAARYLYGPFGRLVGKWGPMADANAMQFSSMPVHGQSGIVGYWGRAYDPNLQRWLQRDPIGEAGGINLYGFVGNNPLGNVDPFGLAYGDWYDPRTYGFGGPSGAQTLPNGDLYMPPAPLPNPNTFGALHGIDLSITGGQLPGDFIADRAMDVAKDSALAMSMFAGLGEEEEGAEAAGGLWKWLKGLASKCKKKPTGLPKIMGHTPSLRNPELVGRIKADMLAGRYRFNSPEGIIAGVEDQNGVIYLTEGQHRMNAALEIYEETGDASYVNQLLQSARTGIDGRSYLTPGTPPIGSLPLPRR